jgi:hypothetical protein
MCVADDKHVRPSACRYESAVEQLSDATSAVDTGAYSESEALVVAS